MFAAGCTLFVEMLISKPYEKHWRDPSKKELSYDLVIPVLGMCQKEMQAQCVKTCLHSHIFHIHTGCHCSNINHNSLLSQSVDECLIKMVYAHME